MSSLQFPPSFPHTYQPSTDSFWDVPRLHKDKIHRRKGRPVTTVGPLLPYREGYCSGQQGVPYLSQRSKSGPAIPTLKTFSLRTSPTGSVDMSTSRFSLDVGSLHSQSERPGGLAQGLRAKGSRLMRRQNSKFNSRSIDWTEEIENRQPRSPMDNSWGKDTVHSRMQSAGSVDKLEISEPYNFQHLTHTHARHFQEIHRASNHDLVSEFSAIRASQIPRRELKGIKAECLPSKVSQSEPASPIRQVPPTPSATSSLKSPYQHITASPTAPQRLTHTSDYFPPQTKPKSYRVPYLAASPPTRSSSKGATRIAPEIFTAYQEVSTEEYTPSTDAHISLAPSDQSTGCSPLPEDLGDSDAFQDFDFSDLPHAVTTPDDTAFPLTPSKLRAPSADLADVPEEDERTVATHSRPSTPGSGLRYAKSFPSTRSNSQRWSASPRKASVNLSTSTPLITDMCQSDILLPLVGDSLDDIPVRPRFSRRISFKPQGFEACWEDDIDYCYEHAAEADCDFDWYKVSTENSNTDSGMTTEERPTQSCHQSISEDYEDIRPPPPLYMAHPTKSHNVPRLRTSLSEPPSLSSANSTKSSSITSLAAPATPSYPLASPQPYGLSKTFNADSTEVFKTAAGLSGYVDGSLTQSMTEEAYDNIFLTKNCPEEQYPLTTLQFEPSQSHDVSPRSSRSPISKSNSQESFMLSRSSSLRYPQSCDSFGSVPELVYSKQSRDKFDVSAEQLVELAATIKAAESFSEPNVSHRRRSSQNLSKDVTRTSLLQKAPSFNSVEEEDLEDSGIVVLPSLTHHERSQSTAVTQSRPSGQRQRSASSATTHPKPSRGSYSLFPPPSVRSPY